MTAERFVLLGLARARSEWFRQVAQWATSAALPADFVKCVSAEEVRRRLGSGRPFSATLLDGALPAVDRDLLAAVHDAGCVPLVMDDGTGRQDWLGLGAAAVLPPALRREDLLDVLVTHCSMVGGSEIAPPGGASLPLSVVWEGSAVAVCGAGGAGSSTVAIALAQGLAAEGTAGQVLLADLCRRAEQAMLHDARELFPGLQELVEGHRKGPVEPSEVLRTTFHVYERGYDLLLGLRRPRFWSALRPRSLETAFRSLRAAFGVVVCDIDADFEGEDDCGSADVEERNLASRLAAQQADAVLVVGTAGLKGLHTLTGLLADLLALGVAPERIVPVLNQAPRQPHLRAGLSSTFAQLIGSLSGGGRLPSPVFLPRRNVEEALRDGVPLPAPLPALIVGAYHAALRRSGELEKELLPVGPPVTPGSLGAWSLQEEAGG
ncbi:MAG: hypothetical protein GEU81_17985 [Nitriliruptorales bacterium]|nr:hypothetical protein [Nitriliruptorales bacterium]